MTTENVLTPEMEAVHPFPKTQYWIRCFEEMGIEYPTITEAQYLTPKSRLTVSRATNNGVGIQYHYRGIILSHAIGRPFYCTPVDGSAVGDPTTMYKSIEVAFLQLPKNPGDASFITEDIAPIIGDLLRASGLNADDFCDEPGDDVFPYMDLDLYYDILTVWRKAVDIYLLQVVQE